MHGAAFFSPDYATARARFREAVGRLGIPLESQTLAARGPGGEVLSIDVATIGPAAGRRVLVLSSGLHGVEGFFGSAVQLAWLAQFASATELPPEIKVVLVHVINPFGMAWLRRGNENNVDLNRNFLGAREFPGGADYRPSPATDERLASFLNPASPPSRWEPFALQAAGRIFAAGLLARRRLPSGEQPDRLALKAIWQLGLAELQHRLPIGQYQAPASLFYGGDRPQESTRWLQQALPVWVGDAELALHVDFHSGLGERADYKLHVVDRQGSPRALWVAQRFGETRVEARDGAVAYDARGTMAAYFRDRLAGGVYHGLTAEFGTCPGIEVLGALRAENRAHFYAAPESSNYRWAKRRIREVFAPAADDWRESVVARSQALVARAIEVCRGPGAATDPAGPKWR